MADNIETPIDIKAKGKGPNGFIFKIQKKKMKKMLMMPVNLKRKKNGIGNQRELKDLLVG